jgi:hypothetical protein
MRYCISYIMLTTLYWVVNEMYLSRIFPIHRTLWETKLAPTNERTNEHRILSIKTVGRQENNCVLVHIFGSSR